MGCGGSKGQGGVGMDGRMTLGGHEVTLYGDYFNADTRSIASILDLCDVKFQFLQVNTLTEAHREESYLRINRAGTVPTLIVGQDKILGGGSIFPLYLAGQFQSVANKLFHEADKKEIEKVLNWFYLKMMPETQRLIRLIVPPKVYGGKASGIISGADSHSKKEEQINNIFSQSGSLLEVINNRLHNTRYIASNELSLADVVIYCEISTIMGLLSKEHTQDLERKFEKVSAWHDQMCELPHLKKYDEHMKEIIKEFNLQEKH